MGEIHPDLGKRLGSCWGSREGPLNIKFQTVQLMLFHCLLLLPRSDCSRNPQRQYCLNSCPCSELPKNHPAGMVPPSFPTAQNHCTKSGAQFLASLSCETGFPTQSPCCKARGFGDKSSTVLLHTIFLPMVFIICGMLLLRQNKTPERSKKYLAFSCQSSITLKGGTCRTETMSRKYSHSNFLF